MKIGSGEWDVRCPKGLGELFPERRGYYYRVGHDTARRVLEILAGAYGIPAPGVGMIPKGSKEYAMYDYETKTVLLRNRNHLKSIFHEFYHHLDNMTDGEYDSSDREDGLFSLAWMFADKLWAKFTNKE